VPKPSRILDPKGITLTPTQETPDAKENPDMKNKLAIMALAITATVGASAISASAQCNTTLVAGVNFNTAGPCYWGLLGTGGSGASGFGSVVTHIFMGDRGAGVFGVTGRTVVVDPTNSVENQAATDASNGIAAARALTCTVNTGICGTTLTTTTFLDPSPGCTTNPNVLVLSKIDLEGGAELDVDNGPCPTASTNWVIHVTGDVILKNGGIFEAPGMHINQVLLVVDGNLDMSGTGSFPNLAQGTEIDAVIAVPNGFANLQPGYVFGELIDGGDSVDMELGGHVFVPTQ
jgi:hypothetical protein